MRYLFIAEKTSVMKAVEETYKKHKAEVDAKIGMIDFTALSGHVCRYLVPKEYPQWSGKWQELTLPMVPTPFVIKDKETEQAQRAITRVKEMLSRTKYDGIIVGTDSDVEGNGIYYLLSNFLKLKDKYKTLRFFEQSMTEKEILSSLYAMTDFWRNRRDLLMTEQFIVRSQFDWLVGMNATVAVSVKSGELTTIGRVKAPVMKLVYDNSMAIDNFKPHSDYLAQAIYREGFTGTYIDSDGNPAAFDTPEKAQAFLDGLSSAEKAVVKDVERKHVSSPAPQLYRLSGIQGEAGQKYNYSPEQTMNIIESLYLKTYVTYPRTDGNYVSSEMALKFGKLLGTCVKNPAFTACIKGLTQADVDRVRANRRVVNDDMVKKASHDALLPTENAPDISALSEEERNIYDMICRRFVAQFLPPLTETKTVLMAEISVPGADAYLFKSTGSTIVNEGWSVLYEREDKAEKIPAEIQAGSVLSVDRFAVHERTTKPPKRLTEASLVTAMENIAKYIEDKDLKKTMREAKGLGTPATRGQIINDLLRHEYIESKGKAKQLYITDTGKRYIENIKVLSITDPAEAARWETMFHGVREGDVTYREAQAASTKYVDDFLSEIEKADIEKRPASSRFETGLVCPYCGKPVLKFKWGWACQARKDEKCTFAVQSYDGKVHDSDVKTLIEKKKTRVIKGVCVSKKDGRHFDARLVLNPAGSQYPTGFAFENGNAQKGQKRTSARRWQR